MKFTYKTKLPAGHKKASFEAQKGLSTIGLIHLARKAVADAKRDKQKKIGILVKSLPKLNLTEAELGELVTREILLADYEFTRYKETPKGGWNFIGEVGYVGKVTPEFKQGVERGRIVAGEINSCRELSNIPGGEMTPMVLATGAKQALQGLSKTKVNILGKKEIEKLGMGAILGVAKGSMEEPKFIIAEYLGGEKDERPIVLVGKGITFDSGGLQLKPAKGGSLHEMHLDMSGGAAVIHTIALSAKLGIKKNIVGLVPAAENMVSGSSYRPGDILRALSGKTIEVGNTDAEGRLILADALTYAERYNPKLVIDVATLTGGAMVALGAEASAIFTSDKNLADKAFEVGEETGDRVWPLPLWDEYLKELKSAFADINNAGKSHPYAAASVAAIFLKQFTLKYPKDCKWMHIDIAPTMTPSEDEYLAKGAKGSPIKLLLVLIEQY